MAIYHFSASLISRGKGQSAIAAAAYRSGDRLDDERYGETKFYKRDVRPETMILAPNNAPDWVHNRQKLWNAVEKNETRKNSQLAREFNVALPKELTADEQRELIKGYVQDEFVSRGMVADVAIHRDHLDNPHAHVMLTTREMDENGFTKKNRDWNSKDTLQEWRSSWSEHANRALEQAGRSERITHESHEERKLETLPTVHLGHVAAEMEQKGIATARGEINRQVTEHNATVTDLAQFRAQKEALTKQAAAREQAQEQAQKEAYQKAYREAVNARIQETLTAREKLSLNNAFQITGETPTFESLKTAIDKADSDIQRLDQTSQQLRQQQDTLSRVADQFRYAEQTQVRINQASSDLDATKNTHYGLFKQRQKAEDIERLETRIKLERERLADIKTTIEPYAKTYHFSTRTEFDALRQEVSKSYQRASSERMDVAINRTQLVRAQDTLDKMRDISLSYKFPTREATRQAITEQSARVQTIDRLYADYQTVHKEWSFYKKEHDRNNLTPQGERNYQQFTQDTKDALTRLKGQGIQSVSAINKEHQTLEQLQTYNQHMEARNWHFEKGRSHEQDKGWDMER